MDTSSPRLLTTENRKDLVRHADESIDLFKLLARIDKPIIAAVHGYALGAGCSLAFGCDLVVAAESARFAFSELPRGLTASTVTAHAVHLLGPDRLRTGDAGGEHHANGLMTGSREPRGAG